MEYAQAKAEIERLPRFSQGGPSLARIGKLLDRLGHPEEQLTVIHIAGTNGKGSTAMMIAQTLWQAGYAAGLYLSPGILDFRERMQIGGKMIPEQAVAWWTEKLLPLAAEVGDINESEFLTAMAYAYFAQQGCTFVVAEAGLGGRWDATNVIRHPAVSVITAIGLDHTAVLGDTLTVIAGEKSGIIKAGCPVVTCPHQGPEALVVLKQAADEQGSLFAQIPKEAIRIGQPTWQGTDFWIAGEPFHVGMAGRHQVDNAATALTACRVLRQQGWDRLTEATIQAGLLKAKQPARLEVLSKEPLVVLDGAHNPQGGRALADALTELTDGQPLMAVVGVMADKDSSRLLEFLAPELKKVLCVTLDTPRSLPAAELKKRAQAAGIPAEIADSIPAAWDKSCRWAKENHGGVIWCGSLHLAAQLHDTFNQK